MNCVGFSWRLAMWQSRKISNWFANKGLLIQYALRIICMLPPSRESKVSSFEHKASSFISPFSSTRVLKSGEGNVTDGLHHLSLACAVGIGGGRRLEEALGTRHTNKRRDIS